jgi:hypothetical protein
MTRSIRQFEESLLNGKTNPVGIGVPLMPNSKTIAVNRQLTSRSNQICRNTGHITINSRSFRDEYDSRFTLVCRNSCHYSEVHVTIQECTSLGAIQGLATTDCFREGWAAGVSRHVWGLPSDSLSQTSVSQMCSSSASSAHVVVRPIWSVPPSDVTEDDSLHHEIPARDGGQG